MRDGTCLSNLERHPQILSSTTGRERNTCLLLVVLDGHPHIWQIFQPQDWRVMLSLHLRLSIHDTIFPLYCRQCHTTMDSAGDLATLKCQHAPCGRISRHEHVKKIIAREGLLLAWLNCAFEAPLLIPNSDKRPGDLFAFLEAPSLWTLCRATPR
jgi:hypothetical protein